MTGPTRWSIDPEASRVEIDGASSVHPIRAEAAGLAGWIQSIGPTGALEPGTEVSGFVAIDVQRLGSGNPLIDRETRRRIQARRHPQITGEIVAGLVVVDGSLDLTGIIEFRGERIEVEGSMVATLLGTDRLVLEGASRFDVRWWGLRLPRLGLLRVYPEIDVSVHVEADREG